MSSDLWRWAHTVAEAELAVSLPQRWAHSPGQRRETFLSQPGLATQRR
jgi:hypothetical protein